MDFKLSKPQKISIRIIFLFVSAIIISTIPDYLHNFFGDWYCTIANGNCDYGGGFGHHSFETWHWGYRHWLFFVMGLCLAMVQVVSIISTISNENEG